MTAPVEGVAGRYQQVAVALDGSPLAESVLPSVEALAARANAKVILLRTVTLSRVQRLGAVVVAPVGPGPIVDPTPALAAEVLEAAGYLEEVAERLRARGVSVTYEVLEGSPADSLVARAAELEVDLIAMTTHGRTGVRRAVFGSVADEVLRSAGCPVLLIRAS